MVRRKRRFPAKRPQDETETDFQSSRRSIGDLLIPAPIKVLRLDLLIHNLSVTSAKQKAQLVDIAP